MYLEDLIAWVKNEAGRYTRLLALDNAVSGYAWTVNHFRI